MLPTLNIFTNFLAVADVLSDEDLYEVRLENNNIGQVLYVGKTIIQNALTSDFVWYIKAFQYDGNGFISRIMLPNNGPSFTYSWDLRSTYF